MMCLLRVAACQSVGDQEEHDAVSQHKFYQTISTGQLHVRYAGPERDDHQENVPVILFHQSPNSSQMYHAFQPILAQDRKVYAPDTPGFGMSDRPLERPSISDFAAAMIEMLDSLGIQEVDLVGYHTGVLIATEIAVLEPELIRRIIMVGIPWFDQEIIDVYQKNPWPRAMEAEDSTYVCDQWDVSLSYRGPGQTLKMVKGTFMAKLQAGETVSWGHQAAFSYPTGSRMSQVDHPVLVLNPNDDLWDMTHKAKKKLPFEFIDLPDYGFGVIEVAPEMILSHVKSFLD